MREHHTADEEIRLGSPLALLRANHAAAFGLQTLFADAVVGENLVDATAATCRNPCRLRARLQLIEIGHPRFLVGRHHQEVRLLDDERPLADPAGSQAVHGDDAVVLALLVIVRVGADAVPGVEQIDLAGRADVRHGVRGRFDVHGDRVIFGAGRKLWFRFVAHLARSERRPAHPAHLHVVTVRLQRLLRNRGKHTPRARLARAGEHGTVDLDAGRPDVHALRELLSRKLGLLRVHGNQNRAQKSCGDESSD